MTSEGAAAARLFDIAFVAIFVLVLVGVVLRLALTKPGQRVLRTLVQLSAWPRWQRRRRH